MLPVAAPLARAGDYSIVRSRLPATRSGADVTEGALMRALMSSARGGAARATARCTGMVSRLPGASDSNYDAPGWAAGDPRIPGKGLER